MKQTKFHELCMAYGNVQQDYGKFETDCHVFAIELVKQFRDYLKIPDSQFSLYKINEENEFVIVPPALVNAITTAEGSYWQFGIGLTVCSAPETLPQDLILIHILIRKDLENKYYAKFGPEPKEFEIDRGKEISFNKFFEFLHKTVISSYQTEFQKFVGQNTFRKLGFKFKNEKEDYK